MAHTVTADEDALEESLEDLMHRAFKLSMDVSHSTVAPGGHYLDTREKLPSAHVDMIYAWADGLVSKHHKDVVAGRCSLAATINFDIEALEIAVRKDIAILEGILRKVGAPARLTHATMAKRGYRGAWAGFTRVQDAQYHLDNAVASSTGSTESLRYIERCQAELTEAQSTEPTITPC